MAETATLDASPTPAPSVPPSSSARLVSLDAFRGLTIAGMILVNNPGSWAFVYAPLAHAEWHGWTPTDLIFPYFLFIMGVAIPLSFRRRLSEGVPRTALFGHVVRRSLLLIAIVFAVVLKDAISWPWLLLALAGIGGIIRITVRTVAARKQTKSAT